MIELKFYKGNLLSIKGQILQRSAFNGAVKCEPYCLNKERGIYTSFWCVLAINSALINLFISSFLSSFVFWFFWLAFFWGKIQILIPIKHT